MFRKPLSFIILSLLFFLTSFPVFAKPGEEELVNLSVEVPSPVSLEFSKLEFNTQETLADPVNHPILFTVILLDKDKNPLLDKEVVVTSNRGKVDMIEAVSKLPEFVVQTADFNEMQKDKTDEEGKVAFRITSFIPGEATFAVVADNVVAFNPVEIKFLPSSFTSNITLSIDLPFTRKDWVLLSPEISEERLSPLQQETKALINPGTEIGIPFWLFFLISFLLLGSPIFIFLNFLSIRRVHGAEKLEIELLRKIAKANDIHKLRKEVRKNGFDHDGILDGKV